MSRPTLIKNQARRLLEKYHAGHLNRSAFCKKYDVGLGLFSYWAPKLRNSPAPVPPHFHEVHLPTATQAQCILTLPSGARIEFPVTHLRDTLVLLSECVAAC